MYYLKIGTPKISIQTSFVSFNYGGFKKANILMVFEFYRKNRDIFGDIC